MGITSELIVASDRPAAAREHEPGQHVGLELNQLFRADLSPFLIATMSSAIRTASSRPEVCQQLLPPTTSVAHAFNVKMTGSG
ncbi:hypothetical protein HD597_000548 [Nonomuraea thailandensis]|uniref:Uncharacterized protein n=1 Tax=Nonomuraea thailandensis TaxID=1188745 RepID=A0A9X2JY84_9ACTN|nr:hypothetical protein [Nonomuraea thailandensis]MCP2353528.1 hypothetical protein [Nonomuraea thailandensis]